METLWFVLVAAMITGYVLLDGFDLGAGFVHLAAARTERERAQVLASIGPFWDGNEVWLVAGGGTLYFAFPVLYSSAFSGFYLPLMIVLWLLILRGIAIEFRHQFHDHPIWTPAWDATFSLSSALLCVFFGAALGNVVRGVPLDANAEFFLPLWTDFTAQGEVGILDWYTILTGLVALAALALHGSLWVALRTEAELYQRSRTLALRLWPLVVVATLAVTAATFAIRPDLYENVRNRVWLWPFPAMALAALALVRARIVAGHAGSAFLASCAYLAAMLASVAATLYPVVLPSNTDPARSLTIFNASAPEYGLAVGLWWWVPGMLLAVGYACFLYRRFSGKVLLADS